MRISTIPLVQKNPICCPLINIRHLSMEQVKKIKPKHLIPYSSFSPVEARGSFHGVDRPPPPSLFFFLSKIQPNPNQTKKIWSFSYCSSRPSCSASLREDLHSHVHLNLHGDAVFSLQIQLQRCYRLYVQICRRRQHHFETCLVLLVTGKGVVG
jgi:hypothetical protein